ncbi:hypothetical protein G7B40_030900 [Aetokthonos hydrillicola Thurmond2011]|jgi:hypothetical protein|uniref:Mobilization protein n=2 Tax=Aetokthonos TaxID=1550243 RepID=A0AAP5IFX1_9CYAN|nr:hypothetical protein [Aetokthonos hydrillicola]MBO3463394.1 hypothetical protein [Aetokthonos hydrillicola CCALA 1050]MBW4589679.1 hypothetical protein [Aetokthonos hydrillicola CCALA 1050]MDR9898933.1 hypothetical protein [Aetokthonos hydrillicola Thurmond2011]
MSPTQLSEIIFIGGEAGGVGKSKITKTLAEMHIQRGIPFSLWECDRTKPDVHQSYGKSSSGCNLAILSESPDMQDASNELFNAALTSRVIANLPANSLIPLKGWIANNNIIELCQEFGVTIYIWLVSDGTLNSQELTIKTMQIFRDNLKYVVVKNLGKTKNWDEFDNNPELNKLIQKYSVPVIELPEFFGDRIRQQMDAMCWTFGEALEHYKNDPINKRRIQTYLQKSWAAFDEAGVYQ